MNNSKINTLLIDFGGVIYDIDTNSTILAFKKLFSNVNESNISNDKKINYSSMPFLSKYERGEIDTNEFLISIAKAFNIELNDNNIYRIINAWNVTLSGLKPEIDRTLEELSKNYNLYLLSNTNELHYNYFIGECSLIFNKYFKKLFFSHKMGTNKPNLEIFEKVLNDIEINPENVLFIDDSKENIDSAKILKINTYQIGSDNNSIYNLSDYLHTVCMNSQL